MVDSKKNYKFDLGVKGLTQFNLVTKSLTFIIAINCFQKFPTYIWHHLDALLKKKDKNQLPITKKALLQFVLDISTIANLTFYFIVANS